MKLISSLCAMLLILGGCGVAKDRFYVLGGGESPATARTPTYTLTINSLNIPAIVDRPQFVLYQSDSRVELMEHERWAEPLRSAIPLVLARELRTQLPDAHVTVYPAPAADALCRIHLDVQRMEARRGESALVEASWSFNCIDGRHKQGYSLIRESAQDGSYEALSSGFSRAYGRIAREMAEAFRALPPAPAKSK